MRPRLLTWLGSFIGGSAVTGTLPRLRALAEAIRELLRPRRRTRLSPSIGP